MPKDSVIVVYIPNKGNFLEQFYGLYYSVVHKTTLYEKFDFLVCAPLCLKNQIPSLHCKFVAIEEISCLDNFTYAYSKRPYGFTDSFAPFIHDKCIDVLLDYKYCIRLDTDTFLCEAIRKLCPDEDEIYTGVASYSSETARKKLPEILKEFSLPDQNIPNIGSTWFSSTPNMVRQAARTLDFVSYLLKNEFQENEGKWPQWYAGVILLYAGHLALNSSSHTITKTDKFDFHSTSDQKAREYYSLHCWHTDKFFSKFAFGANKYKDRKPKSKSLRCDEYSFDCALKGRKALEACRNEK